MSFSPEVKEEVLVACGRCCCICHKFCGLKIEVHHIQEVSEGGDNSANNAIPLCFDCHADMRGYDFNHPKGNKFSRSELLRHRDNWYEKMNGNIGLANKSDIMETDKKVYEFLTNTLPWDNSIKFIKDFNFGWDSFESSELKDFWAFLDHYQNPAFKFIDPDLEKFRANLYKHIEKFMHTIAAETFSTNNKGFNSIPMEWKTEQPERFEETVNKLHDTADMIVECYANLIKTGTRKLGILAIKLN